MSIARRIFSGIQPTGIPHLGNYFGAIEHWIKISNSVTDGTLSHNGSVIACDEPIYSIVDVHAYGSKIRGKKLYDNILSTTASLIALGLDTSRCTLFRQSDILEHNYLENVFENFVTSSRLKHMIQYKSKSALSRPSLSLLTYPVLQAADILLYKASLVPVGEDQAQHLELAREMARKFNSELACSLFPDPETLLNESIHSRRLKSLRNPERKMSKSDEQQKSFIRVIDEPEVIVENCKKALTDLTSRVSYEPETRPGVANLIVIYHLVTGKSISDIELEFESKDTARLKLDLADALIERFKNTRKEYNRLMSDPSSLERQLNLGAEKALPLARRTVQEVRHLLGSYLEV